MSEAVFARMVARSKLSWGGEHAMQAAVFRHVRELKHPRARLIYAIPNAALDTREKRIYFTSEGASAGVPDVHMPWAEHGYVGAWIEHKLPGEEPSSEQLDWAERLQAEGHFVFLSRSAERSIEVIDWYLGAG